MSNVPYKRSGFSFAIMGYAQTVWVNGLSTPLPRLSKGSFSPRRQLRSAQDKATAHSNETKSRYDLSTKWIPCYTANWKMREMGPASPLHRALTWRVGKEIRRRTSRSHQTRRSLSSMIQSGNTHREHVHRCRALTRNVLLPDSEADW